MSHKSSVKACITGPLHPVVAAQAAQLLVQLMCPEGMSVVVEPSRNVPIPANKNGVKTLAALKSHGTNGWDYEYFTLYLDQKGELNFYQHEYTARTAGLTKKVEAAWQQAYTACAIAAALRMQGKQVQVQPTRQGELQIIGS